MGNLGMAELLCMTFFLMLWVGVIAGAVWVVRRVQRQSRELDELRRRLAEVEETASR